MTDQPTVLGTVASITQRPLDATPLQDMSCTMWWPCVAALLVLVATDVTLSASLCMRMLLAAAAQSAAAAQCSRPSRQRTVAMPRQQLLQLTVSDAGHLH
jgi:hypothetical protein